MKAWSGTGEAYAASYAGLCAGTVPAVVDILGEPHGRRMLDIGSGTGDLLARCADAGWQVTGCEPEPTMRAVSLRAHPDLTVEPGSLPVLPFPSASFDAVTANFVLNHVADPRRGASAMAGVGRPGARLIATIWTRSPSWFWIEVCERASLVPATGRRLSPTKDFARTAEGFAGMLIDAGWHEVRATELSWTWFPEPGELWASAEGGVASAGQFYLALDADGRRRFRHSFEAVCSERESEGVVPLVHTAAVGQGLAP